jgi:hypothetical protein
MGLHYSTLVLREPPDNGVEEEVKNLVSDRGKYTSDDSEGGWGCLSPATEEWDIVGRLRVYNNEKFWWEKGIIRTEAMFARTEIPKRGTKLMIMTMMRRNHPIILFFINAAEDLSKFSHIYAE